MVHMMMSAAIKNDFRESGRLCMHTAKARFCRALAASYFYTLNCAISVIILQESKFSCKDLSNISFESSDVFVAN
jgi:hypothetical protein